MPDIYHEGNRNLQDEFDSRRLADRRTVLRGLQRSTGDRGMTEFAERTLLNPDISIAIHDIFINEAL